MHLGLGKLQLGKQLVDGGLVFSGKGDVVCLELIFQEDKHIKQRDLVAIQPGEDLTVLILLGGVAGVQRLHYLVIQPDQLGKLPGAQGIRQLVAAHSLHAGKAHGAFYLGAVVQLRQDLGFRFIIAAGQHHRNHVAGAKGVLDLKVIVLPLGHFGGFDVVEAIGVGTMAAKPERAGENNQKQGRHYKAGLYRELTGKGNVWQQLFVAGLVDQRAEQDQQTGHQGKYAHKAQEDGLDQHHGKIHADAKLHEPQGHQTADGGQGRAADFGDGFTQSGDGGVPGVFGFVLVAKAVAQDDGVVNGKGKLQHHRHGIGNKADLAAKEIGAHIQQGGCAKGKQQHRHLHIRPGGKHQHQDNNDHRNDENDQHFLVQHGVGVKVCLGIDGSIVHSGKIFNFGKGLQRSLLQIAAYKADIKQSAGVGVMLRVSAKGNHLHALYLADLIAESLGSLVGNIGYHHPGGGKGSEIFVHGYDALPGLRAFRQVDGNIVFYLYPAHGDHAKKQGKDIKQEEILSFIHDKPGHFIQKSVGRLFTHSNQPLKNHSDKIRQLLIFVRMSIIIFLKELGNHHFFIA